MYISGLILDIFRVGNRYVTESLLVIGFLVTVSVFILLIILFIYAKNKKLNLQNYIRYFNSDFRKAFTWSKWGLLFSFVFFLFSLLVTGGKIIFFMLASGSVDFWFNLMVFNMLVVFPLLLVLLVVSRLIIFLTREK